MLTIRPCAPRASLGDPDPGRGGRGGGRPAIAFGRGGAHFGRRHFFGRGFIDGVLIAGSPFGWGPYYVPYPVAVPACVTRPNPLPPCPGLWQWTGPHTLCCTRVD